MPKRDPAKLTSVKVKIPWVGEAEWTADTQERRAAWSLYVELVTRVSMQRLSANQGSLRESLNSLHSLFDSTRQILREAGPDIGASPHSVGGIAIAVLNLGVRPFVSRWHPQLSDWESVRDLNVGAGDHERKWGMHDEMRLELNLLRDQLVSYANGLAVIAGVATSKSAAHEGD